MNNNKQPLGVRFDAQYVPVTESGCWLWVGATLRSGYGRIRAFGKGRLAHRVSWSLHNGILPDDADVLHRCDTPQCVNPQHLFLGDDRINVADRAKKGRNARNCGLRNGMGRLTDEQISRIRADPRPNAEVAAAHGISRTHVSAIRLGRKRANG